MSANAQKVFEDSVLPLAPAERLQLAALILDELTGGGSLLIERSDTWSPEDEADLTAFSLQHAADADPAPGADDLLESAAIGIWADYPEAEESTAFARKLRAESLRSSD